VASEAGKYGRHLGSGRGHDFWGQGKEQVMGGRGDTNCASRLLEQFVLIHLHSYSIIHG